MKTCSTKIFEEQKKNIGLRIRNLRESLGMKQGPFAKMIGISQGTLSNIESCQTIPSSGTVASIVIAVKDVDAVWLLTGEKSIRTEQYQDSRNNIHAEEESFPYWIQAMCKMIERIPGSEGIYRLALEDANRKVKKIFREYENPEADKNEDIFEKTKNEDSAESEE